MPERAAKPEKPNPLFSKNIPPPPVPSTSVETRKEENSQIPETLPVRQASNIPKREQATVELSLYLRPSQDDKLEDLRRAYKRHTGRKISANEVVRRLIDQATIEDLI